MKKSSLASAKLLYWEKVKELKGWELSMAPMRNLSFAHSYQKIVIVSWREMNGMSLHRIEYVCHLEWLLKFMYDI